MSSRPIVRPFPLDEDKDLVREAERSAFLDAAGGGTALDERVDAHLGRLAQLQASGAYRILGAELDEARVGVLLVDTSEDGLDYVDDVYVRPAYRRRGVARALLAHLHASAARQGRRIELTVTASNEAALGLYTSLGYEIFRHRLRWSPRPG